MAEWHRVFYACGAVHDSQHGEPMEDWLVPLMGLVEQVHVFGTREAGATAEAATDALGRYLSSSSEGDGAFAAFRGLRELAHRDLVASA